MLTLIKRTGGIDTSDANAGPYQILEGYSGYVDDDRIEGTMPNRADYSYSLPVNTSHNIPDGFHNGNGKITQALATQDTVVITPGRTPKLVCAADRWTIGNLWVEGDPDLVAGNIKVDTPLFGVTGNYRGCVTTDATVTANEILTGYSAYGSAGTKINGTMTNNGTTNHSLALNGSYTIPEGWHNGNGKVTQSLTTQAGWTATPGTGNILLCSANRWTTGDIWVKGDANLVAGNIKKGVTIFGVTGTLDKFASGNTIYLLDSEFNPTNEVPTISTNVAMSGCWREGPWLYFHSTKGMIGWQFDLSALKTAGKSWTMYYEFGPLVRHGYTDIPESWTKRFYIYMLAPAPGYWQGQSAWNFRYWESYACSWYKGIGMKFGPDVLSYRYTLKAGRCWITID